MRFVRCGSRLFKPDAVTAVDLDIDLRPEGPPDAVKVSVPGETLFFRGAEADAVRAFFNSMPASDLMHRYEPEAPEAVAANHSTGEC